MAYLKIECSVARNRKFVKAGPAPSWLWVCGLAYCQEGLTDGFIPSEALKYLGVKNAAQLASHLVKAGLWDVVDGGWLVHDYLEHNKSAADVEAIRASRAAGGQLGGRPRKNLPDNLKVSDPKPSTKPHPNLTENPSTATATEAATATATPTASVTFAHTPIVARRRLDAAWEGAKGLYVPQRKHADFVALRNHTGADAELFTWYEQVAEAWVGSPGADMMKFWTARFGEKWPEAAAAKSASTYSNWRPRTGAPS